MQQIRNKKEHFDKFFNLYSNFLKRIYLDKKNHDWYLHRQLNSRCMKCRERAPFSPATEGAR